MTEPRQPPVPEADLSKVRTIPIATRANKVEARLLAHPPGDDRSFDAFLDSLPDMLAARDLKAVVAAVAAAAGRRDAARDGAVGTSSGE